MRGPGGSTRRGRDVSRGCSLGFCGRAAVPREGVSRGCSLGFCGRAAVPREGVSRGCSLGFCGRAALPREGTDRCPGGVTDVVLAAGESFGLHSPGGPGLPPVITASAARHPRPIVFLAQRAV